MAATITIDTPRNGSALPAGTVNFTATGSYFSPGGPPANAVPISASTCFGTGAPVAGARVNPPTIPGADWQFQCAVPPGAAANPFFLIVQVFGPAPVTHFIQVSVSPAVGAPPVQATSP